MGKSGRVRRAESYWARFQDVLTMEHLTGDLGGWESSVEAMCSRAFAVGHAMAVRPERTPCPVWVPFSAGGEEGEAPFDGSPVYLLTTTGYVVEGQWGVERRRVFNGNRFEWHCEAGFKAHSGGRRRPVSDFSHWMPYPKPLTAGEGR